MTKLFDKMVTFEVGQKVIPKAAFMRSSLSEPVGVGVVIKAIHPVYTIKWRHGTQKFLATNLEGVK